MLRMRRRMRLISHGLAVVTALLVLSCAEPEHLKGLDKAHVVVVRDGDTIELDDGRVVRYIGIDTPERGSPGADSATALNRELVYGKDVRLDYGHDLVDRYGRALAIVYVDGKMVNLEIIAAGWAWCYLFDGNLTQGGKLLRAQQSAITNQRGIWRAPTEETADHYVASFSGFRFHLPTCESVPNIRRTNKVVIETKREAFFKGYSPCGSCRP